MLTVLRLPSRMSEQLNKSLVVSLDKVNRLIGRMAANGCPRDAFMSWFKTSDKAVERLGG